MEQVGGATSSSLMAQVTIDIDLQYMYKQILHLVPGETHFCVLVLTQCNKSHSRVEKVAPSASSILNKPLLLVLFTYKGLIV